MAKKRVKKINRSALIRDYFEKDPKSFSSPASEVVQRVKEKKGVSVSVPLVCVVRRALRKKQKAVSAARKVKEVSAQENQLSKGDMIRRALLEQPALQGEPNKRVAAAVQEKFGVSVSDQTVARVRNGIGGKKRRAPNQPTLLESLRRVERVVVAARELIRIAGSVPTAHKALDQVSEWQR